MKKFGLILICFFILTLNIKANERQIVSLNKCVDGDTAWFNLENKKIKARFLAINTPESTNKIEAYGKEASEFTCNELKGADAIEIEYDDNSDSLDKYDRHLVWVFVDNNLLQEKILLNGLGEIKYVYGDYKYLNILNEAQNKAKENKLNIWNNYIESNDNDNILYSIIVIIAIIIIIIIFKPNKKVIKNLIKRYLS